MAHSSKVTVIRDRTLKYRVLRQPEPSGPRERSKDRGKQPSVSFTISLWSIYLLLGACLESATPRRQAELMQFHRTWKLDFRTSKEKSWLIISQTFYWILWKDFSLGVTVSQKYTNFKGIQGNLQSSIYLPAKISYLIFREILYYIVFMFTV